MYKKTVIEIGANNGNDTERLLNMYPDAIIYAFEPTQELLINNLWPKFKDNERVRVLPFAVDIVNSFKEFKIAGWYDWGCSSLHDFADNVREEWPGNVDFKVTHKYFVPTITMQDFCITYGITNIDYLHIDTQGNDFNCLLSFKDQIKIVRAGRCEVEAKVKLYKGVDNSLKSVKSWLIENGFHVNCSNNLEISPEADLDFYR